VRILVTNDDGIDAPGLHALVGALVERGHDLEVAAPWSDRSGSGSGLGVIDNGVEVGIEERELPGLPGVRAFAVDAPPSFAVLACCTGVLGTRPDLVVSGINDGFNTGRLILNSSTVGAVLTAGGLGVRGLAVSAGFAPHHRFDTAGAVAVAVVDWMIEHSAPRTVLNVNVPNRDLRDLAGVRTAALAPRGLMGLRLERTREALRLHRFENVDRLGHGTDSALVSDGYVALTALGPVAALGPGDDASPARLVEATLGRSSEAARP
jgi:5'-nucleotidase